jgi:uncharacterized membrane protein
MKYLQKNSLFRLYADRSDSEQTLILSSLFSMSLICFRMMYTGDHLFLFLVWNLFLAFIPWYVSSWMNRRMRSKSIVTFLACVFVWLLFIPNSFYILTDLFHLDMNVSVPLWYDLALLLGFAWNGLLFGILSVRQMEKLFEHYFNKKFDLLFIFPVMVLNGFGVYVGRYLRFNSWDVFTNPFQLLDDIIYMFIHPIRNRFDWSMIICYSVFLMLIYSGIKRLSREWEGS